MKSKILSTLTALGVVLAAGGASAQSVNWDLVNEYEPNSVHAQTADKFIEELSARSNGEINVTAHHGASLGYKSLDQFDAVGDGAVQVASSYVGAWAGISPIFLLPSLPFLAPTVEDTRALYEAATPYYEAVLEDNNQVFLFATPWPPSGIWANKPVDSKDALSGLRIRTYDANGTVTMREAGANPIQLSWADVVPQLATNGIDAVLTSADGGAAAQLWEHQSHFTEVNYAMPLQIVHINRDVYEGLTDEQKEAVEAAADAAEEFGWGLLAERVQENYAEMEGHGMTVVTDVSSDFIDFLSQSGTKAIDDWKSKFGDEAETLLSDYESRRNQ
ncbi:TRAP transporter substrate-binding protein DctP [Lutibaculum baratangense]|uniref:TRAP dicarboxylate transporter-DctP subunit n=1 Tax=Lutibaculum baratangense AMV1 TaxID=631454 RepID=V4RIK3_9HYPH|nr:TRAP transporter substrate-binding protein DctP [Lutibaculum baratangense]ESR25916.1 TRAP dicarboxylate transporter- DctP subunit [Lutibaculum baratangense AMV1]